MADRRFMDWLGALNERLKPYNLHFAYRVRDEIARFVGYALGSSLADGFREYGNDVFLGAFDAAVLMKVLPKFHGPRAKLEEPLTTVLAWAAQPDDPTAAVERIKGAPNRTDFSVDILLGAATAGSSSIPLPRTARKAARMLYDLITTGFASFA